MTNRVQLLECGLQLFASRGYDAVGVQEICEAAGVTKPTLYHYFGNKRGLLTALVQERSAQFNTRLVELTDYHGDLPHTLERLIELYFQFATAEPRLYRLLLALWLAVPESEAFQVVVAFNEDQQRLIEGMFSAAVVDHGNMRGRQRIYAATLLGTINTYIALALNGYIQLDTVVVRQAVQQFSYGIYS